MNMTWRQLDERTEFMLQDMDYYAFQDMQQDGSYDEPIWDCLWLDGILETLHQISTDMPADHEAEYLDNQRLIRDIEAAMQVGTF